MTNSPQTQVVAFVGFATPLTPYSIGLLRRCGLSVLQYKEIAGACRALKTLVVDAVVLNARWARLPTESPDARALLDSYASVQAAARARIPLIVFSNPKLSAAARAFYADAGAIIVPVKNQSHRKLARLVLELGGGAGNCCSDRTGPQSSL